MSASEEKPQILAFMITRAGTGERLATFERTVREAREKAGYEFDLWVHALTPQAAKLAADMFAKDKDVDLHAFVTVHMENVGQHTVMNQMIAEADDRLYDYLLRLDDDCKFLTNNWLQKMVEAAEKLGPQFIISPTVRGLIYPPPQSETINVKGTKVKILEKAIGGVCRLHHVETLCNPEYPYVSDVRLPLGFGDATGIGQWAMNAQKVTGDHIWMIYLEYVRVKHGTKKQRIEDPDYHVLQDVFQMIPYIPAWAPDA